MELMKPLSKTSTLWSPYLSYAIGLITTDGCLVNDGRHINFTSKDEEQVNNFKYCLNLDNKIGKKSRAVATEKKYYVIQFGDVNFYNFLLTIGLTPNKSKTIGGLDIPKKYFFDFLRGHFDGDGSLYSYWDKRWRNSYMFYLNFTSASEKHILWLQREIKKLLKISGYVDKIKRSRVYKLRFAKKDSKLLISKMYYKKDLPLLNRKLEKIRSIIALDHFER